MINNYYKPGPGARHNGELPFRILQLTQEFYNKEFKDDTLGAGKFYIAGNVEGHPKATADNWKYGVQKANEEQKLKSKVETPFNVAPVKTHSAEEAYDLVLRSAGATQPKRDVVDQRIVRETQTGECKFGGVWGDHSGIIDTQESVGGWPDLKSIPAPADHDQDGMPDKWEKENGLNPVNAEDRNDDKDGDGYTNLEDYLNELAGC